MTWIYKEKITELKEEKKELTPLQQLGLTTGVLLLIGGIIGTISEIIFPTKKRRKKYGRKYRSKTR
jgi:hypothetical protein